MAAPGVCQAPLCSAPAQRLECLLRTPDHAGWAPRRLLAQQPPSQSPCSSEPKPALHSRCPKQAGDLLSQHHATIVVRAAGMSVHNCRGGCAAGRTRAHAALDPLSCHILPAAQQHRQKQQCYLPGMHWRSEKLCISGAGSGSQPGCGFKLSTLQARSASPRAVTYRHSAPSSVRAMPAVPCSSTQLSISPSQHCKGSSCHAQRGAVLQ